MPSVSSPTAEVRIIASGLEFPDGPIALANGSSITVKSYPLDSPNGIALSPDESRLSVAETQVGRIGYWDLADPGSIAANSDHQFHPGKLLYGAPGYAPFVRIP